MRFRLRVGDMVSIPVDEDHVAFGQIVYQAGRMSYFVAVFDGLWAPDQTPRTDEIVCRPLRLLGRALLDSTDFDGHWEVVGRHPVDVGRIPWPAYKTGVPPSGSFAVIDYMDRRSRPATSAEVERLPNESTATRVVFEVALRALAGLAPWNEVCDGLLLPAADLTTQAMFGDRPLAPPEEEAEAASGVDPFESHAVITHLPLSGDAYGSVADRAAVFAAEARIASAVEAIGGEHDGNEIGNGEAILYTYGADADALLEAIVESLSGFEVRPGAYAVKRYGPADDSDAREELVALVS